MIWTLNKYTESQEKQKIKNLSKKEMKAVNGLAEVLIKQTANFSLFRDDVSATVSEGGKKV